MGSRQELVKIIEEYELGPHPNVKMRRYYERMSDILCKQLLDQFEKRNRVVDSVLAAIDSVENLTTSTSTKKHDHFKKEWSPLRGFGKKHFFAGRNTDIVGNIRAEWGLKFGGNENFRKLCKNLFDARGDTAENWQASERFSEAVVSSIFTRLSAGKATGDWIIFKEYEAQNYYLGIFSHSQSGCGDDYDRYVYDYLEKNCKSEFPFLFEPNQ